VQPSSSISLLIAIEGFFSLLVEELCFTFILFGVQIVPASL
jgi:hypothetical protein